MIDKNRTANVNDTERDVINYIKTVGDHAAGLINESFITNRIEAIASMVNGEIKIHTGTEVNDIKPVLDIVNSIIDNLTIEFSKSEFSNTNIDRNNLN